MVTCLCPQCTDNPAPTYTVEYMRECEARMVCAMPTKEKRAEYIGRIEAKNKERAAKLKEAVRKEWNERLANRNAGPAR